MLTQDQIHPGYEAMTFADAKAMNTLNAKNGYGISYHALRRLCYEHKKARERNDIRTMERIEYRLTDINFHSDCCRLARGEYEEELKAIKEF